MLFFILRCEKKGTDTEAVSEADVQAVADDDGYYGDDDIDFDAPDNYDDGDDIVFDDPD